SPVRQPAAGHEQEAAKDRAERSGEGGVLWTGAVVHPGCITVCREDETPWRVPARAFVGFLVRPSSRPTRPCSSSDLASRGTAGDSPPPRRTRARERSPS